MKQNIINLLTDAAKAEQRKALPILSFPATQKLGVSVEELVKDSELQARAIETVARETDTIAAISLMDLSVEAEAFGADVRFAPDEIPAVVGQLVSDEDEANALTVPTLEAGRASVCVEGIRLAAERIKDKPVLAGMIGPYSLAGRLMDVTEIMYLCYDEPETVHTVLAKATEYLIAYAKAFKAAGASGIMMAEPLAGIMSPAMAEEFSVPYVKQIIDAVQDSEFAVIYHNCGNAVASMTDEIFSQGAAAYHFGNAVDMADILSKAPSDILCMGNIDPVSQFAEGTPESMRAAVVDLLDRCGKYSNFVISSGCDIPHHASWENINAFFEAVSEWKN
ncbi:MAG: uroporphyrinogen decarboxylase family protein [Clostridia bacterium]|nr:uroporphyrinogen decarboxylase family protein [Clostridia bacterium]